MWCGFIICVVQRSGLSNFIHSDFGAVDEFLQEEE